MEREKPAPAKSKTPISDAYLKIIMKVNSEDPQGRTFGEMIRDNLAVQAKEGSKTAERELQRWNELLKRFGVGKK
jgi:hypothetical protein